MGQGELLYMYHFRITTILVVLLSGCVSETPMTERIEALDRGDPVEKVIEVLGEPASVREFEDHERWMYLESASTILRGEEIVGVHVIVQDGVVLEVLSIKQKQE